MKPKVTLLMTCVGGDLAPEYLKAFKNSARYDITVVGVDGRQNAVGQHFADHFETVPMGGSDGYIDRMLEIVKKYAVELIIAGSDGEALALSLNRDLFADIGCQIASPEISVLENLNDKIKTYQTIKDAGIAQAQWYGVETLQDLEQATQVLYDKFGEFVIKPALSRGGRDVFVIRSDIETEHHYHGGREIHLPFDIFQQKYLKVIPEHFPVVVMERLYEPTYDFDVLSWNGEAKQVVPRLRHNPAGIPFIGNTIKADQTLVDMGKQIAKTFNLSWLIDVDVMSTKAGKPVVLEVNPRMSGSCPSSIYADIPLFDGIVALARGEEIEPVEVDEDIVVVGYNSIVRVA